MSEEKSYEKVDAASEHKSAARHRYLILQTITLESLPRAHWLNTPQACIRLEYSPRPKWHYDTLYKCATKPLVAYDMQHPFLLEEDAVLTATVVIKHTLSKNEPWGVMHFKISDVVKHSDASGVSVVRGHMKLTKEPDDKAKDKPSASFVAVFRTEDWDPIYSQGQGDESEIKVDWWTKLSTYAISVQFHEAVIVDAGSLPLPLEASDIEMTTVPGTTIVVAVHDPHVPLPTGSGNILKYFNELPFDDNPGYFPNRATGRAWLAKVTENMWPQPKEGTWRDCTTDDNFRQYCFCNAGSEHMHRIDGKTYLLDLDAVMDRPELVVRDKWEPYLGKAFFNEHARPDRIEIKMNGVLETFRPGDKHWEYAKLRIRSGIFVVTSAQHLCLAHLRWANEPQIGTRRYLDSVHPINRLLGPHFYRAALIIAKSRNSLTPEKGLLHRATSFTVDGIRNLFQHCYDKFEYVPYMESCRKRGWGEDCDDSVFPAYRDARDLTVAIDKYCDAYIKLYYETDQSVLEDDQLRTYWNYMESVWPVPKLSQKTLIDYCSNIIFYNSAWHEQMGNICGYTRDPASVSLLIKKGEYQVLGTPESNVVVAFITLMTQALTPRLVGDWTHYFLDDRAKKVYRTFHTDLVQHSAAVTQRNATREFPVMDYDAAYTKLSVSS